MAKIKLVDFDPGVPYETELGTCDLCMSTGEAQEPMFKFQYEDGTTNWVDGYFWSWGDFWAIELENTADFAGWLQKQEFKPGFRIKDYGDLNLIVDDYLYKEEGEEPNGDYYL